MDPQELQGLTGVQLVLKASVIQQVRHGFDAHLAFWGGILNFSLDYEFFEFFQKLRQLVKVIHEHDVLLGSVKR